MSTTDCTRCYSTPSIPPSLAPLGPGAPPHTACVCSVQQRSERAAAAAREGSNMSSGHVVALACQPRSTQGNSFPRRTRCLRGGRRGLTMLATMRTVYLLAFYTKCSGVSVILFETCVSTASNQFPSCISASRPHCSARVLNITCLPPKQTCCAGGGRQRCVCFVDSSIWLCALRNLARPSNGPQRLQ